MLRDSIDSQLRVTYMTDFTPNKELFLSPGRYHRFIVSSIFLERYAEASTDKYCQYSLKDVDITVNGTFYPSLKRLYLEMEDPTEYEFANKYLFNYDHWKELCSQEWFKEHLYKWRDELELRLKARALIMINSIAQSGGRESLTAAKFLFREVWADRKDTPGRPSKQRIKEEAANLVKDELKAVDDLKRLGILN